MKAAVTFLLFTTVLLLAGCASTSSQQSSSAQAVAGVTVGEYREFLSELDGDIKEGTPRELNSGEKSQYRELSETMHDILDSHDPAYAVPEEALGTFLNIHESIQTVVMGSQEGEVVCRGGGSSTGSNIGSRRCTTRNQPTEQQQEVESYFQQNLGG